MKNKKLSRLSPSLLLVVSSFPQQQSTKQIELAANVFSCPFARELTSFSVDFECDVSNTVRLSVLSVIMVGKNLGMIRNLFRSFLVRVEGRLVYRCPNTIRKPRVGSTSHIMGAIPFIAADKHRVEWILFCDKFKI